MIAHTPSSPDAPALQLAAGWYIALRSDALSGRPVALQLFARPLVAWRDANNHPVIMPRHCRHMGASLALGKVIDGCIRCPFHHWRFAASGRCVEMPGVERMPVIAHQPTYPATERYGFIWCWYGTPMPLFALPEFPPLEADRGNYVRYRFADVTPASVCQVLENAYDAYHFMTLHGVNVADPLRLTMLSDPEASRENGPPIAAEAWSGAQLESSTLQMPAIASVLGMSGEKFRLLIDGWPGGQRLTFFLDGKVLAKELLGVSPVAEKHTIQQGWSLVPRTGRRWRDALNYVLYRVQHRAGAKQDLAIYQHRDAARSRVPVKYDRGVLAFREHYQRWVSRAHPPRDQVTP